MNAPEQTSTVAPLLWPVIKRGVRRACPQCGKGKLFQGYLKQVEQCAECGEAYGHIRADDGPAWLTIIIVGHLFAPFLPMLALSDPANPWLFYGLPLVIAFGLILLILPFAKGFFLAMIWRMKCTGAQKTS